MKRIPVTPKPDHKPAHKPAHKLAPTLALALLPAPALAAAFERPIPQPQTEMAEISFLVASVALVAALAAVQYLVSRR